MERINTLAAELQNKYPLLSEVELLTLAVQIRQVELLESKTAIEADNNYPVSAFQESYS